MAGPQTPEQGAGIPPNQQGTNVDPRLAAQEAPAASASRTQRPTRDGSRRPDRTEIARESRERYVATDRLEGMFYIPPGVIPPELEPRWVRIMRTQTVPDEENYQRSISEGYVELDVRDFPNIRRMRNLRPMPGFETCEIRGGLLLMVRDRAIGLNERKRRQKRVQQQMKGLREWVSDNPEEAAYRMVNPSFQRMDLGTKESTGLEVEQGPSSGMFKE